MIKTRQDLNEFLAVEKKYYCGEVKGIRHLYYSFTNRIWNYSKSLRHFEYHYNNLGIYHKLVKFIWKIKKDRLGERLGYEIGPNVFDKGLLIFHSGSLIINDKSKVGKNCTIIGSACLGSKGGGKGPVLGDNCELGMNSVIIGEVVLGDNVHVGAGAIVTKSFPESNISLAGVPAKIIIKKDATLASK